MRIFEFVGKNRDFSKDTYEKIFTAFKINDARLPKFLNPCDSRGGGQNARTTEGGGPSVTLILEFGISRTIRPRQRVAEYVAIRGARPTFS